MISCFCKKERKLLHWMASNTFPIDLIRNYCLGSSRVIEIRCHGQLALPVLLFHREELASSQALPVLKVALDDEHSSSRATYSAGRAWLEAKRRVRQLEEGSCSCSFIIPGHDHCCVFGCTNRRNNFCGPLIAEDSTSAK